ncbi:hypothetical protein MMC29_004813 [Sticta canariensis]|nr:hypothetical protein [Sticta canariensis]
MSEYQVRGRFASSSSQEQENFWQDSTNDSFLNTLNSSSESIRRVFKDERSIGSNGSKGPYTLGPLRVRNANTPPRSTSLSTVDCAEFPRKASSTRRASKQSSLKFVRENDISSSPRFGGNSASLFDAGPLEDVSLDAENVEATGDEDAEHTSERDLSFEATPAESVSTRGLLTGFRPAGEPRKPSLVIADTSTLKKHPFRRWVTTLRRRNSRRKGNLIPRLERWSLDEFDDVKPAALALPGGENTMRHKKSSSWSSSAFVTAVQSATASLLPLSIAPQSRKTRRSGPLRSSHRSSRISDGVNRASMDSNQGSAQIIDEAAWGRAVQRRRTLEELISSEESYITDLKFLINVYFTLIASASNEFLRKSPQIRSNITEILTLHEELLIQIRRVMPDSELKSDHDGSSLLMKHTRWRSIDSPLAVTGAGTMQVARRSIEAAWFGRPKRDVLISEPCEVAEVAKVFGRLMGRFFVYEEYGAKYESMLLEMTSTSKAIPNFQVYERGIEALAHSLASTSTRTSYNRKGMTFEDLLIKPIQRVCKYPLLFADLEKNTPSIDDPESRAEVEKVSCRLRDTAYEINRATNDQETKARIQRSWRLQDLLILPDASTAPASLRLLGHAILCGVLYVAYQSKNDLRGGYMLCVLFKSYLILAIPKPGGTQYNVMAIMSLSDIQIDKPDNGRGLQCHTAPYSWKLVFESHQQLYELILCACSAREEEQWKSGLSMYSSKEGQIQREDHATLAPPFYILLLDIRSLGHVFGVPGTLTHRISIQRAATVSPRTNACQVIIKNTNALKDSCDTQTAAPDSLSRSQSLLSTNRVLTLAPKRGERLRMEHALTEVWTRDLLPYPGMSPNRGENLIRTSANSMMRKLSRATMSNSFTKCSTSNASLLDEKVAMNQADFDPIIGALLPTADDETSLRIRSIEPPTRTSSVKGTRFSRGRRSLKHRHGSGLMAKAVSCEEVSKLASPQEWNNKRRNPRIHLKTFSADGIRNLFT